MVHWVNLMCYCLFLSSSVYINLTFQFSHHTSALCSPHVLVPIPPPPLSGCWVSRLYCLAGVGVSSGGSQNLADWEGYRPEEQCWLLAWHILELEVRVLRRDCAVGMGMSVAINREGYSTVPGSDWANPGNLRGKKKKPADQANNWYNFSLSSCWSFFFLTLFLVLPQ